MKNLMGRLPMGSLAAGWALTFLAGTAGVFSLAACSRDESANTPLPTREKTIGRVEQSLQKADEETAKRREEIDNATK